MTVARVTHGLVAAVVLGTLGHQLVLLVTAGTDASTGEDQTFVPVAVRLFRDGRAWRVLRLDSLLGIAITGIVYWTLLAPLVRLEGGALLTGLGFHLVAPLGALGAWLLFGPRPRITWTTVAWAFAWPGAWIVGTLVRGAVTGGYPYPFLDVSVVGYPRALAATGGVLVLGLVLAVVLRRLDRTRTWRQR